MALRIAVITDIHHGEDAAAKKGSRARALMAEFAAFVAEQKPDLVLDLGDRISDVDPETDIRLAREVHAMFEPIRAAAPVHHICGNHDRDFLTIKQNEAILGQSLKNETLDIGGWRIALFRADSLVRWPEGFRCPDSDIAWLSAVVREADRPLLVASHVPCAVHSALGNYYFENNPRFLNYPEAPALRLALRASRVPLFCIAGHVHWNTVTIVDAIPHLTQQSLTESFTMAPEPGSGAACGAYGLITIADDTFDWQVFGADAFRAVLPVGQTARRWYAPLNDFSELPGQSERTARQVAFQASLGADAAIEAAE